jgi:uncharacterized YccA/Bax inhibitor family protein
MANPLMSDKAFDDAAKAGWGAPAGPAASRGAAFPPPSPMDAGGGTYTTPISDGPVSEWHGRVMSVNGTVTATGVLMVLLIASAAVGWSAASPPSPGAPVQFPWIAMLGVIVGFGCVIGATFRPMLAKYLAPAYALAQGFFVGVISRYYEEYRNGIVLQAIGATICVFAVMLFLYKTRILKVTDRFRRIVIGATLGLMVFYLISFVISLVAGSGSVSFLSSASGFGIAFSVFAAGLAAFNLALDFDFIERGAQRGYPKGMEWFAALGMLVTIVWLYLELLRLLSKLQRR